MMALIGQNRYDELLKLSASMDTDPSRPTRMFIPVGPTPSATGTPRILFIGQSGYEHDDGSQPEVQRRVASFEEMTEIQAQAFKHLVLRSQSPFWKAVRLVTERVLRAIGASDVVTENRWAEIVGWSNMLKVYRRQVGVANPDVAFLQQQVAFCVSSLTEEIAAARPTAVVIFATKFGVEIVQDAFGPAKSWLQNDKDEDKVSIKWLAELGVPLFWTDHPHTLHTDTKGAWQGNLNFIAGCVAGLHAHPAKLGGRPAN